jgi:hypothetical protein
VREHDLADIAQALALLRQEVDQLRARESIRDCIYRFNRGLDRIDRPLMGSAFHEDAQIDMGKIYQGGVEGFLDATVANQARQAQAHHLVGNILIRLEGEAATVESYELARHKSPRDGDIIDLILAMRLLDRFERRDGEWRIVSRKKVMDWGRIFPGGDGVFENSPLAKGTRDWADPSYDAAD